MIRRIDYHGLDAVEFSKGAYTALVVPSVGANLIRLAHTGYGIELLHTPDPSEIDTFRSRPQIFGLPLLFPPNRIADGTFDFDGRTYRFPITNEKEHNFLHGLLKGEAFAVSKAFENDEETVIECRYYSNAANDAFFRYYGHEFKCKMIYRLTAEGLSHEVVFTNRSDRTMPVGVGYHTPLMIPFAAGTGADYRLRLSVGERVELDARNIPTGRTLPLGEFAPLRGEGFRVTECEAIEAGFTMQEIEVDGRPFKGAVAEHLPSGRRIFYEVDPATRYWTLWNNGGDKPYCCPEPQSWITDAPHASDPEAAGLCALEPGAHFAMRFRLYAQ